MTDYQEQAQEEMWDAISAQDAETAKADRARAGRTSDTPTDRAERAEGPDDSGPRLYVTPEYWGDRPGYSVVDEATYRLVKWFPVEELAEAQAFAEKGGAA